MARIGIFGGSFDPPHLGHVQAVLHCLADLSLDLVIVVPCSTHAFGKEGSAFGDRINMARLAFRVFNPSMVVVSDIEGGRTGTSYTVDTLRAIKEDVAPQDELILVAGKDIEAQIEGWKDIGQIREMASIKIHPRTAASSTAARSQIMRGETPQDMQASVMKYISDRHLYGKGDAFCTPVPARSGYFFEE